MTRDEIQELLRRLERTFPQTECFLRHETPWQLLIAILLSAQATDRSVNEATKVLFAHFPTLESLRSASEEDIEKDIHAVGLSKSKARNVKRTASILVETYGGKVPLEREKLEELPGVGHKTSGVFLAEEHAFPYLPVDTHVHRVSERLGLVRKGLDPDAVETILERKLSPAIPIETHRRLILLGRNYCLARNPRCDACPLLDLCPEGRKRLSRTKGRNPKPGKTAIEENGD